MPALAPPSGRSTPGSTPEHTDLPSISLGGVHPLDALAEFRPHPEEGGSDDDTLAFREDSAMAYVQKQKQQARTRPAQLSPGKLGEQQPRNDSSATDSKAEAPTANGEPTRTSSPEAATPPFTSPPFRQRPRQPSALADRSSIQKTGLSGSGGSSSAGGREKEAAALATYLGEAELDLSMSTFTALGTSLSHSQALRVLNLRGSTMPSEGLRGLADIPTLHSICVSHMRKLTSLVPLITPSRPDARCGLQEIDAQCTPLRNEGLRGLERLPRLRKLDLSLTGVTDVSLLAASHSLRELSLAVTQVSSDGLRGLERIPTLVSLNVSRTKVTSIRPLTASRSLQTLLLYSCKCTDDDIKGIEKMPRLAVVDLSTTKVTNLSIFRTSPSLKNIKAQWLALKNCVDLIQERRASQGERSLDDLSVGMQRSSEEGYEGLADVPTLETVDLSFNTLRSVRSLCRSNSIKHLILRRTKVDSAGIMELHRLSRTLETLEITNLTESMDESSEENGGGSPSASMSATGGGPLCNVNILSHVVRLTRLDLSFTDVYDLRVLRSMPTLKELVIVETLVTVDGLRGIEEIPTLELLDLSQTSVMSLQFLAGGAPALKKILVKSNRNIRGFRLGRIEGLPSLESLDMGDTVVEDVRVMWSDKWRLKELTWRWRERREAVGPVPSLTCWVTSERLSGLANMPALSRLDLTNSSVHSLDFLLGAARISSLNLDGCRLLRNEHIAAISKERFVVHHLEELNLANNQHYTDLTCLAGCQRLHTLNITNDTGLHPVGLEGVWNLPTLRHLDMTNSGAEEAVWFSATGINSAGAPHMGGHPHAIAWGGGDAGTDAAATSDCPDGGKAGGHKRGGGKGGKELGTLRDVSAVLSTSVAPVQFRVPRRRRVSFVGTDPSGGSTTDGDASPAHS